MSREPAPGELACQDVVELVTAYLDDALPAGRRMRFEQHLATCAGCDAHLDQLRRTIALAGRLECEHLSPAAERTLLAAFRGWRG